jgi:hypothetical protein
MLSTGDPLHARGVIPGVGSNACLEVYRSDAVVENRDGSPVHRLKARGTVSGVVALAFSRSSG